MTTPNVSAEDFAWKWTRLYRCYVCEGYGSKAPGAIRVFSGIYSGGWAACDHHASAAITEAMRPLVDAVKIDAGYTVKAYHVRVDEDGFPKLGALIFRARQRTVESVECREFLCLPERNPSHYRNGRHLPIRT